MRIRNLYHELYRQWTFAPVLAFADALVSRRIKQSYHLMLHEMLKEKNQWKFIRFETHRLTGIQKKNKLISSNWHLIEKILAKKSLFQKLSGHLSKTGSIVKKSFQLTFS